MRNNLTKKEIGFVSTKELNYRYCRLLLKGEALPANKITVADAREILWIEDQLRMRTIKAVGHDFYPPDRIEKQAPSNYMISIMKRDKVKPKSIIVDHEMKTDGKFSFKITITSSIGSIVARQDVKVDSRSDANIKAQAMIKDLGLKKATYKIS